MQPSAHVLQAFGAFGPIVRLAGGRGIAWRAGDVVLKPLDMPIQELTWLHENGSNDSGRWSIRQSLPMTSRTGELVVDGWTAFPVLEGEHRAGNWVQIAEVAGEFAELYRGVDRPAFLDERTHAWARADRLAWGEGPLPQFDDAPLLTDLLDARRFVSDPSGIIHGDLAGNVLFDDTTAPAVIDLTLYWRPVRYAIAIVAVDAVCFEGAPFSLLEKIEPSDHFGQHLVRALIFRIATDWFNRRSPTDLAVYRDASRRVLELVSADSTR